MQATVASFLPFKIVETKPGLIPDTYTIEASDGKTPAVLVIKEARGSIYIGDGKSYPIPHLASEIARSIVNDYCASQLQSAEDAIPAVIWVDGEYTPKEILVKFPNEVATAIKRQKQWFIRLVRLADDDWARTGQHRMISDIQRHAARSLGLINKAWYHTPEPEEYVKCPACASLIDSTAAICQKCNYIVNKARALELGIKVA